MYYDINKKNTSTISNKINRCSILLRYMYNKLINDDVIQRYTYYLTANPLADKGREYDGDIVYQPPLTANHMKDIIYDIPFNTDMEQSKSNSIYLSLTNGRFTNRESSIYAEINVLVPSDYINVADGYRHTEISSRIADIFDGIYVDNNKEIPYYKELGGLRFDLYEFYIGRLSKTNDFMVCSLKFKIDVSAVNGRV